MVDGCGSSSRLSYYTSVVSPHEGVYHSYDCDWIYPYLPGYPVVLITTGGCMGDPYGYCGFFCLSKHTHAAYARWYVGACLRLMIVIIYGRMEISVLELMEDVVGTQVHRVLSLQPLISHLH